MTPLRQRMSEDMQLRHFSPRTQEAYLAAVSRFAKLSGKKTRASFFTLCSGMRYRESKQHKRRERLVSMPWIEDAYYIRLPSGPPCQGDIWNNLPLPSSDPPYCTGILITPRCDLVHDKSPVINYLPVISLEELLVSFAGFALLERELQHCHNLLRQCARALGVTELLEVGLPPGRVLDRVVSRLGSALTNANAKQHRNTEQQVSAFQSHLKRIEEIESCLDKPKLQHDSIRSLIPAKELAVYKRDAIKNKAVDLHFLPSCLPLLECPSFVLMRYAGTCSVDFIRSAESCVSQNAWDQIRMGKSSIEFSVCVTKPERLLRLRSPYLEALMARFGALFSRVGVRDFPQDYIDSLVLSEE